MSEFGSGVVKNVPGTLWDETASDSYFQEYSQKADKLSIQYTDFAIWQRIHFDRTTQMLPCGACVHDSIHEQSIIAPDAVAVEFEGQVLTYSELDRRSERLAQILSTLEIGSNDLVAICVDRSLEMVVALLGVLKAGAAYLVLDPESSQERLTLILRDAAPCALITYAGATRNLMFCNEDADDFCVGMEIPLIYLDAEAWEGMEDRNTFRPRSCAGPHDLAYVSYASDSDANLNGIQIPHRAFANLVESVRERVGIDAKDTWLALAEISPDTATLELLLPLATGAKVVIVSAGCCSDVSQLLKLVERVRPTVIHATPATWQLLLQEGWQGQKNLKVLCSGDEWPEELSEQLLWRCGSLWKTYGLPETTVWSAISKIEPEEPILIAEPIANTSLHVLDSNRQPVSIGVPGELYIGGDGVALGYLHQPELTAYRFIKDPFRSDPDALLFRTGNCVRYRREGGLELLGRVDLSRKSNGIRIGVEKIEGVLQSEPNIAQTVVVYRAEPTNVRQVPA